MLARKNQARRPCKRSEASIKGKLLEKIVAAMHDAPGVTVTRNVKLPALGFSGRPREIDVLIETTVAGYPVKIAIECKNLAAKIDPERIDSFVGKLQRPYQTKLNRKKADILFRKKVDKANRY